MTETVGDRLYLIRLACGDGRRKAESQEDFSTRVKRLTGREYSSMTLSLLERMKQTWKLEDVEVFAKVDPRRRGPAWLAGFAPVAEAPDPSLDRRLSEEEELRALRRDEAERRDDQPSEEGKPKRKRGRA